MDGNNSSTANTEDHIIITAAKALIQERNYSPAIDVLIPSNLNAPSNEKRRLLAQCFIELEVYEEAAEVLEALTSPTDTDCLRLALAYWDLEKWDEMSGILKRVLANTPNPIALHWLAAAEARGRKNYEFDEASRQLMIAYLSQATELANCIRGTYLWLVELHKDTATQPKILNNALERFPDDKEIRLELTHFYIYRLEHYEEALKVLDPLIKSENSLDAVQWYRFKALAELKRWDEALEQLELIEFDDPTEKAQIKADVLFVRGCYSEWLAYSEQVGIDTSKHALFFKHLRRAFVNLRHQDYVRAIEDFRTGCNALLETNSGLWSYEYLHFKLGERYFEYVCADIVLDVCESLLLLSIESPYLSDTDIGFIALILHYLGIDLEKRNDLKEFLKIDNANELVLLAARLLNYPPSLGNDLLFGFADDPPRAIECHLKYCLWAYSKKLEFNAEVHDYVFSEHESTVSDKASEITAVAIRLFREANDSKVLEEVFLPFYLSFWRDVLFEGGLFTGVVEVTKKFVEITNGEECLFDYAYALHETGSPLIAADVYKRILKEQPDNAAVLNNLAVIHEEEGDLIKASELFGAAAEKESSKELYKRNVERVKSKIELLRKAQKDFGAALEKIKQKAAKAGLTPEQHNDLNEFYWETDMSTTEIQQQLGISSKTYLY